ncbi:MAG: PAS domain-containing protein [Desulfuromonadales bacterium]
MTDHVNSEVAALQQSEDDYRLLFESMLNGLAYCRMLYDEDGKSVDFIYLDVNEAFKSQTGLNNVVGKKVSEVIPGILDADPQLIETYGRVAMSGIPERFEGYLESLQMWFSVSVYCPKHEHFVALFDVITERKMTEMALLESQQRLRFHVDNSPMAIVEWDSDFIVTRWAGESERIFGWTQAETIGKPIMDLQMIFEEDIPVVQETMRKLSNTNSKYVVSTNRNYTKDRKIITCEWYNTVLNDSQGKLVSVLSQVLDISARKQAEDALVQSESILKASQILAKVGGWEWDVALQAMTWTEETYRIHDIEPSSITPGSAAHIEKSLSCYHPEYRKLIHDAFMRCIEQGESYDLECRFTSVTGRKLWIRTTAQPEYHGNHVVKVIGNIMDITERKNLEDELTRQADFTLRVFNSLDSNMAVIDSNGVILSVNEAWSNFAKNNLGTDASKWGIGANYFVTYDRKYGDVEQAEEAFDGVRKVQSGQLPSFSLEYPCHGSGNEQRWFVLHALPLLGKDGSVLLSHLNITERKLAQDALKEAEWKFRALFENGPIGVAYHRMIYDDTGKAVDYFFIDANQNYITLTGVDPRGKTVTQAFPGIENDPFDWIGTFDKVARTGETMHFEQYLQLNDRWYDVVSYQYKPGHFVASFAEISERKKAEERLQYKQDMLARTERITHTGSWELDVATGAVTWSDELFRITQLNPADGTPSVEDQSRIYNPEDMKNLLRVIEMAVSDGTPYEIESRIIRPNGETRICRARGFAERGAVGKVMRLFGSFQDITERRQAEECLEKVKNLLSEGQKIAHMGTFEYVADTQALVWSEEEFRIYGLNPEEPPPTYDFMLANCIHPDDAARLQQAFSAALQNGSVYEIVHRIVRPDGSLRWLHNIANPYFNQNNKLVRYVGVTLDITERKQAEEEKQALEQQLQQAQKLESLGVLAGGIAHDFNNILAIIMGYCGLTKMDYETAEKNIPEMEKAVERAAALCRQMLAYAGKAPFEITQVDMCMVVTEMSKMLQSTIAQNVVIKPELAADVPCILGDASQLRQVLMNLIINAAEAIGDAQGEVRVTLSKKVLNKYGTEKDYLGKLISHGCYVCLDVTDTGCGMSDETYNRLFEPFYTTKFHGRGLGMSAMLGIINTHHGALQLSSELGKGTTFKIYLPVQISDCAGEDSPLQVASVPWQGSGTILLVEDEVQVLQIARTMLEALGFTVIEASNGKEGLELFQKNAADINLVITDMGMPVMDGYQLFRELKTLKSDLPIIISSGFGDSVVESRIASEDIAGSISKPYSFDRLRDVLKSVTEGIQNQT